MLNTKFQKAALYSLLGVSLLANVGLVLEVRNLSNTRKATLACSEEAQEKVSGRSIGSTSRDLAFNRIYEECLKTKYGIDQKLK